MAVTMAAEAAAAVTKVVVLQVRAGSAVAPTAAGVRVEAVKAVVERVEADPVAEGKAVVGLATEPMVVGRGAADMTVAARLAGAG